MTPLDPVVLKEMPLIRKIIRDETWFEGERRGCPVSSDDPVVRDNVCQVIFRVGAEMRRSFKADISADSRVVTWSGPESGDDQVA
jgi:hypothetical protein